MRLSMKVTTALAALSLCLISPTVLAEEESQKRWFQVEILIFENPGARSEHPEQWPTYPKLDRRSPAIEVGLESPLAEQADTDLIDNEPVKTIEKATLPEAFLPLTPMEYQLTQERTLLEEKQGFRTLYHQAWIQPVPGRDEVIPIRVEGGETYGQNRELQGYIELYVERYLHLTTDLQLIRYTQTDNPFRLIDENDNSGSTLATRLESFGGIGLKGDSGAYDNTFVSQSNNRYYVATESIRLNEKRRMRSKELHYLDNPKFGLLFLVTPIEVTGNSQ